MKYLARFHGRRLGAIGVTHNIVVTVDGDTPEAAQLALYERFEHLSGVSLLPMGSDPEEGNDRG